MWCIMDQLRMFIKGYIIIIKKENNDKSYCVFWYDYVCFTGTSVRMLSSLGNYYKNRKGKVWLTTGNTSIFI